MSDQQPEQPGQQSGAQPVAPASDGSVPQTATPRYGPPPQHVQQQYAPPQYAQPQAAAPRYAQPGLPYVPPPTAARRLPAGAWIGIGAGALAVLLAAAVGVVFLVGVIGAKPRSTAAEPSASPSPSQTPPSEGGVGSGNSLDTRVDFAAGPFWAVEIDSANGWTAEVLDRQGINRIVNERTTCALLTYQGSGDPNASTADDRAATDDTIAAALKIGLPWTAATESPDVRKDSTVSVPIVGGGSVEMQRLTTTYPTKDGERQRTILLRAFTPGNAVLMAQADCPSWAMPTFGEPALAGISVTDR